MTDVSSRPRVAHYDAAPPGVSPLRSDVPWRSEFVEIVPPATVTLLEEWGPQAAGPTAVGPLAITSAFRVLSDEGLGHLQAIAAELEAAAPDFDNGRVPKHSRGAIYRSEFIRGMHTDPSILRFLGELAGTELEPHPNGHHASHFNFAPTNPQRAVDPWHTDVTAFDCIMHVFDIDGMQGGDFEYFAGAAEEGRDLLLAGDGLPPERIVRPVFPGAGWMLLQQGPRVLHHASALRARWRRCTYVPSFVAYHPDIDDPDDLRTLVTIDGPVVAPVEYARHRAMVASRRLHALAALDATGGTTAAQLAAGLDEQIANLEVVVAGLERPTAGAFINYGDG